MKQIGTYRLQFAQTPDGPAYSDRPIYGVKEPTFFGGEPVNGPTVKVLVDYLGGYAWINVDRDAVTLAEVPA